MSSQFPARLQGGLLLSARIAWLVIATLCFGLFLLGLPPFAAHMHTVCTPGAGASCPNELLSSAGVQTLQALGISVDGYVWYTIVTEILNALVWAGVGLVIFWRRSDEWIALLTAFVLVTFNPTLPGKPASFLVQFSPLWTGPLAFLSFLVEVLFDLFIILFPNGRFAPRWIGWAVVPIIVQQGARLFVASDLALNANNWPEWLNNAIPLLFFVAVVFSHMYRYQRILTPTERQQTKWVLFGIVALLVGGFALSTVIPWFLLPPGLFNIVGHPSGTSSF
jgi:hypothetical protein